MLDPPVSTQVHVVQWYATKDGVYRFQPDQRWLDLLKKNWNRLVGVTKYVGPLAKAFGKVALWVGAAGLAIEKLPVVPQSPIAKRFSVLATHEPELIDVEIRYLLQALIAELDSKRDVMEAPYGGLHPYIIDDRRLLWLCPRHIMSYKTRL